LKEIAEGRPTIVFCASVEHAHHAAELWQQAGYTAAALDGETDNRTRYETLREFQDGRLQVLCNCALFTEGMDAPRCACIVHLRPTKSWNLYVQMTGRGTRTLPGIVDGLLEPDERRAAIAASDKRDCIVLDMVDISGTHELCSVPSILDLPANIDLQGHSVTDTKKLLDEFEEVRERVIGECPLTYQDLQVRLAQVNLLRQSKAKTQQDWKATESGFRFTHVPPGYKAELNPVLPEGYELRVTHHTRGELLCKTGKPSPDRTFRGYLDHAQRWIQHVVEGDKASQPAASRGTLQRLTEPQQWHLRRRGHSMEEIDGMPYKKAKALLDRYVPEYHAQKQARELAEV
jgi:hypothetical protein